MEMIMRNQETETNVLPFDDDDDDDNDDDDDELFCGMVDRRKAFAPYFHPGPLSELVTIANLRHAASRV